MLTSELVLMFVLNGTSGNERDGFPISHRQKVLADIVI